VAAGVVIAPALIATFGAARSVALIGVGFALVTVLGCLIVGTSPLRPEPSARPAA
jgi:hypothetical protein